MPALLWLDRRLAQRGTNADEIVREELQKQGATNVTVRNILTSMRLISTVDWTEIFESVSLVDATLRGDPNFAQMGSDPTVAETAIAAARKNRFIAPLDRLRRRDVKKLPYNPPAAWQILSAPKAPSFAPSSMQPTTSGARV